MLAVVGGEGRLPVVLMEALEAKGQPFRLCEVEGFEVAGRGDRPVMRFRLETIGGFIEDLVRFETTQVCFAGRIDRPEIDLSKVDAATRPLLPLIAQALQAGDDAALRIVMKFFEQAGLEVVAATAVAPELLPPPGVLTKAQPDAQDVLDAERGAEVIGALAQADVGQSCVISNGQALAIEALPGTDWMLRSLEPPAVSGAAVEETVKWVIHRIETAQGHRAPDKSLPGGGILVKASKPGQDGRVDLPAIGLETVASVSRARLRGIVIEAGGVMVLDLPQVVEEADRRGLFVWVRE